METFYLDTLYKAIELILLFWLLGLLFKWTLMFVLGEKGAKIIGFLGYMVNFALKKFVLSKIFRIEVFESDPFKLKFEHEETDRWDILFTSLVVIPMGVGLVLGSTIGTIGLLLEENFIILSIFLYIIGFLIAVNSIPTFQDVKKLKDCSIRSIILWFIIGTVLCAIIALLTVPFLQTLGIILSIVIGIMLTSVITFFIPIISEKMNSNGNESLVGGTVDLDG